MLGSRGEQRRERQAEKHVPQAESGRQPEGEQVGGLGPRGAGQGHSDWQRPWWPAGRFAVPANCPCLAMAVRQQSPVSNVHGNEG